MEAAAAREIAVGMYAAASAGVAPTPWTPAGAEAGGTMPASSSWSSGVKLSTYAREGLKFVVSWRSTSTVR